LQIRSCKNYGSILFSTLLVLAFGLTAVASVRKKVECEKGKLDGDNKIGFTCLTILKGNWDAGGYCNKNQRINSDGSGCYQDIVKLPKCTVGGVEKDLENYLIQEKDKCFLPGYKGSNPDATPHCPKNFSYEVNYFKEMSVIDGVTYLKGQDACVHLGASKIICNPWDQAKAEASLGGFHILSHQPANGNCKYNLTYGSYSAPYLTNAK
jgi:hypothetical protein